MEVVVDARDARGEMDGTETPARILASALAEGHEVEVVGAQRRRRLAEPVHHLCLVWGVAVTERFEPRDGAS